MISLAIGAFLGGIVVGVSVVGQWCVTLQRERDDARAIATRRADRSDNRYLSDLAEIRRWQKANT